MHALRHRAGFYPLKSFPAALGKETSGTIVALPTDPEALKDPVFKSQDYVVGGKVAAVRHHFTNPLRCSDNACIATP